MTNKEVEDVLFKSVMQTSNLPDVPVGVSRFQAFLAIKPLLNDKQYWYALRCALSNREELDRYALDVKMALLDDRPCREFLMNPIERDAFRFLPKKLRLFRISNWDEYNDDELDISWSLEEQSVKGKNKKDRPILDIQVAKEEAIACFERNWAGEPEVIYCKPQYRWFM